MNITSRAAALAAVTALVSTPVVISAPAEAATKYSSCDKLTRAWPNGVARNAAAAQAQVRQGNSRPASGPRARAVYQENKGNLDRDKDGTACEN